MIGKEFIVASIFVSAFFAMLDMGAGKPVSESIFIQAFVIVLPILLVLGFIIINQIKIYNLLIKLTPQDVVVDKNKQGKI